MLYFCCFYNNINIFILCEIHKNGIIRFEAYTTSLMIPYVFFYKIMYQFNEVLKISFLRLISSAR